MLDLLAGCLDEEQPREALASLWRELVAISHAAADDAGPVLMAALSRVSHPRNGGIPNRRFEPLWRDILWLLGDMRHEPALEYVRDFMSLDLGGYQCEGPAAGALASIGTAASIWALVEEWFEWGGVGDNAVDVEEAILSVGSKAVSDLIGLAQRITVGELAAPDDGLHQFAFERLPEYPLPEGVRAVPNGALPGKLVDMFIKVWRTQRSARRPLRRVFKKLVAGEWRVDWSYVTHDASWMASALSRHARQMRANASAGRGKRAGGDS